MFMNVLLLFVPEAVYMSPLLKSSFYSFSIKYIMSRIFLTKLFFSVMCCLVNSVLVRKIQRRKQFSEVELCILVRSVSCAKWQPTPVFLPGEFHGLQSLAGYNPWDPKEWDVTQHTYMHAYRSHVHSFLPFNVTMIIFYTFFHHSPCSL